MINFKNLISGLDRFKNKEPFDHCIIDDFFDYDVASLLSEEFIPYDSDKWFYYRNPIEDKKALNDWNIFPALTYKAFSTLNSSRVTDILSQAIGVELNPDNGLHGGGWHIHANGGNLNPHFDYSIHPKLGLQRKINIIIYLSKDLKPDTHGGHLGLWSHDKENNKPGNLEVEISPVFNRAVIFDTTQNSWHGMSRKLATPNGIYRKSLAIYYLCEPIGDVSSRGRALFAPRKEQEGDKEIEQIIKLRSQVSQSSKVYKT